MAGAESRIRLRVSVRTRPSDLLSAIREYATPREGKREGRQWSIARRRPLVLRHASRRAQKVKYSFAAADGDVELRVTGKDTRIALAFAVTLLANKRFADQIERFEVELPA